MSVQRYTWLSPTELRIRQGTLLKNRSHYLSLREGVGLGGDFLKGGSHKTPLYPPDDKLWQVTVPQVVFFPHVLSDLIKSILESEEFWPRDFFFIISSSDIP